jgi:hypothetical protein
MVIKNKNDAAAAVALLASTAALYAQSHNIVDSMHYALGGFFFPYVMLGTIAVLSLILLYQSIDFSGAPARQSAATDREKKLRAMGAQAGTIALLALYIFILPFTGYVPTTVVFLIVCMAFLGERSPKRLAQYAVCAAITTAVLYVVFGKLLYLFLP